MDLGTIHLGIEKYKEGKIIMMKNSYMQKKEDIVRNWYVIDAEGQNLGRVATKVAHVLRGKHKATYTPHVDCGDFVIVVNASKVKCKDLRSILDN